MSVLDSLRKALGSGTTDPANDVRYHCQFCDCEFETAYSFCPECGSERITETA